jgi:hypothetical protein
MKLNNHGLVLVGSQACRPESCSLLKSVLRPDRGACSFRPLGPNQFAAKSSPHIADDLAAQIRLTLSLMILNAAIYSTLVVSHIIVVWVR